MALNESVRGKAVNLSFDLFGVADPFVQGIQRALEGHRLPDYLIGVKSVVALGVRVLNPILQSPAASIVSRALGFL